MREPRRREPGDVPPPATTDGASLSLRARTAANRSVDRSTVAAALVLALLSFALGTVVSLRLSELRVYDEWDVWFNADPNVYLATFADRPPHFDYRHPAIWLFTQAPIAAGAHLLEPLHLVGASPEAVRRALALLLAPAAGACRSVVLLLFLRGLVGRLRPAIALCLLDAVSFAGIAFGSIPESYPLSALAIAAMYLLAYRWHPRTIWRSRLVWTLLGATAIAVTITNAIPFVVLLATSRLRAGASRASTLRALGATLAVATLAVGGAAWAGAVRWRLPVSLHSVPHVEYFYHLPTLSRAAQVARGFGHTFLAPRPGTIPTWAPITESPDYRDLFSFSVPDARARAAPWRGLVTAAALLLGISGFVLRRGPPLDLAAPTVILLLNFVLHLFYGHEYALYALHWQASLLVLLAGIALLPLRDGAKDLLLFLFAAATAVNSALLMRALFASLSAALH